MIELEALPDAIEAFQIKIQQGGNLDIEIRKIQSFFEQGSLILDEKSFLQLNELVHKISFFKDNSKQDSNGEICKVFNGISYVSYIPEQLQNLEFFLSQFSEVFEGSCDFVEITAEELEELENLSPEIMAIFFNENEIQLSSCEKLCERLFQCGKFVLRLDLFTILGSEEIVFLNNLALDEALSFCPSLNQLDITGAVSLEKDPLEIIAHHCPQLSKLSLSGCKFLTVKGVYELYSKCKFLQLVELSDCIFLEENKKNSENLNVRCEGLIIKDCKGVIPEVLRFI
jgi:hypothetical protein